MSLSSFFELKTVNAQRYLNFEKALVPTVAWLSGKSDSIMVQKVSVFESELGQYDDWKTFSVFPSVNGYLFRVREGHGGGRTENCSYPMPKTQWG